MISIKPRDLRPGDLIFAESFAEANVVRLVVQVKHNKQSVSIHVFGNNNINEYFVGLFAKIQVQRP